MVYIEFTLSQRKNEFYRSIVHALEFYGGSPKKIIFDNLKAAVISGSGRNAVLHPEFAALCGTYCMEPIACEARDPESKGLVENTVRYVKRNALAGRDDDTQHRIEALQMRHRRSMTELEKNFGTLGEEAQAFQLALSKLPVRPMIHLRRIVSLIELYGREAVLRAMRVAIEYQTIDAAYVEAIVLQERRKASLPSPLPLQPKRKDLIQLELDIPDPGRYDNLTEKEENDDQSQA